MNGSLRPPRVALVDPSRFTVPYDAGLSQGLERADVDHFWAVRPLRNGDPEQLPPGRVRPFFYENSDAPGSFSTLRKAFKGVEHVRGLARLLDECEAFRANVIHFQWTVLPLLDAMAIKRLRRKAVVVVTVHDAVPYNGQKMSWVQTSGLDRPLQLADALVVHTKSARGALIDRGLDPDKIHLIEHGPLPLGFAVRPLGSDTRNQRHCTLTMFGELKPYKGLDFVVEALAHLDDDVLDRVRVVVAGRHRMDVHPIERRISQLGLTDQFEFRPYRLSEAEMAELFSETHAFLFPYRQIDASGVYYLVRSLGRWLIASRVGIFAESIQPETEGTLVPPGDIEALASAIRRAVVEDLRPAPGRSGKDWETIGQETAQLYQSLLRERAE